MSNIPKQRLYQFIGWFLVPIFLILVINPSLFILLFRFLILVFGCWLFFLGFKFKYGHTALDALKHFILSNMRTIDTAGGDYNEQVQSDVITIKDNQIYINPDLSEFTAQIQALIEQIQSQGNSKEVAEKQVIDELRTQARHHAKFRARLRKWKKDLDNNYAKVYNDPELVKRIIELTNEASFTSPTNSTLVVEDKFQKLHDLLQAKKWKEADEETVKVILSLMPEQDYSYVHVDEISPKDLRSINHLWVKYSNGRFGFSVQKRILEKILNVYYRDNNKYLHFWLLDKGICKVFIDCVGWPAEKDRLYYKEINYSLSAPRGHLPALIIFDDLYTNSNYCSWNKTLFDDFMKREYSNIPFVPSWLKAWLLIE